MGKVKDYRDGFKEWLGRPKEQELERFPPNETPMMPMPPEEWEKDVGEEVNDAWARGEHIPGVTQ